MNDDMKRNDYTRMNEFIYPATDTLEIMTSAKRYNAFIEKLVIRHSPGAGKILDIGAGIGTFAQRMRAKGYAVRCIEPDGKQRKRIEEAGLPAHRAIEEVADHSADYIYSLNVLEHIENDRETLALWAKKLKPGGKMFIYVPAFNLLYSPFDKQAGHCRRYRKKTLVNCFTEAGLQIEKAGYADSVGFFVSLIYKLINSDGKISNASLRLYDRFLFPVSRFCDTFCSALFGKNVYAAGKLPCERTSADGTVNGAHTPRNNPPQTNKKL